MGSAFSSSSSSPSRLSLCPAPAPPPTPPQIKYDVFLSFRGEDTRHNFTSHLDKAFRAKGIDHFIDYQLKRGDEISHSLLQAIEGSLISVVIFSKHYADSRWCLEELVKILECKEMYGQIVMPIFYKIEPTDVRHQTGSYEAAFAEHQNRSKKDLDKVQRWKDALKEAANLSGLASSVIESESALVEKIVENVVERLNNMPSSDNNKLVRIESKIAKIEAMLGMAEQMNNDVRKVGICGIGGIGKTTLAIAVFDKTFGQFEGFYFSGSVREAEEKRELDGLKQELYSMILKESIRYISTSIKKRLSRKKVLIVFDDVSSIKQIELLIGDLDSFHLGSRIIITSRDRQVLKNFCGLNYIYVVEELCLNDSLELFCRHAFKQNCPKLEFKELSKGVVEKVGGVPLALKVLGSFLLGKGKEVWESSIEKLENILDKDIYEVLKISYDGLDPRQQRIFLDIACFYKGWDVDRVKAIMETSYDIFFACDLSALEDKCLIIKLHNNLMMHDLLQAMGKTIDQEESKDPKKRIRLWNHNEIHDVLIEATGTQAIEGISWDMSNTGDIHLHCCAFENMHTLRFLRFYILDHQIHNYSKVHVSQDLKFGSTKLSYFQWDRCPLKLLPYFRNLVILNLLASDVEELWSGIQEFNHLREIYLSKSENLIRFPDLRAPKLKYLDLSECTSLIEMPSSFQHLNLLVDLRLSLCKNLMSIPELPESLTFIHLGGCLKLQRLPKSIQHLTKLDVLNLWECKSLTSVPDCSRLISLQFIVLNGCSKLERVSKIPTNCRGLNFSGCTSLFEIPSSFNHLNQLESLCFADCKSLTNILDLGGLESLKHFAIVRCSKLKTFPNLPNSIEELSFEEISPHELYLVDSCVRLKRLPNSFCSIRESLHLHFFQNLWELNLCGCGITEIPDNIGCLTSLESLELDRNNFERIPGSIINLTRLWFLSINHCERLKVLPKLSWGRVNASNCTSLQEVSCPSFPSDLFAAKYGLFESIYFVNCFNLDQNSLDNFGKDAQREIRDKLLSYAKVYKKAPLSIYYPGTRIPKYFDSEINQQGLSICYPGIEIPEWFDFRSNQSSIDVKLPMAGISSNFPVWVAVCAVVSPLKVLPSSISAVGVGYNCILKSNKISVMPYGRRQRRKLGGLGSKYANIKSSHLFIGFVLHFFHGLEDNEFLQVRFKFWTGRGNKYYKVEKCGVSLISSKYLQSDESEENEPHRRD